MSLVGDSGILDFWPKYHVGLTFERDTLDNFDILERRFLHSLEVFWEVFKHIFGTYEAYSHFSFSALTVEE